MNLDREDELLRVMASQDRAGEKYRDVQLSNYLRRLIISAPPGIIVISLFVAVTK